MKIGVYIPTASFFVGGGEVVPLMQAKYLAKYGYDVTVIVAKVKSESNLFKTYVEENPDINIIRLLPPTSFGSFDTRELSHAVAHELYYALGRVCSQYLIDNKFDIVMTHYDPATLYIPNSVKQLYFLHGVPPNWDIVGHASLRLADKVIAVSNSIAKGWNEKFGFHDITVVQNGIDEKNFIPQKMPQDIDVLYVGRLIEIKGVQYLIKSIDTLRKKSKFKNINIEIGGKGPYESSLKELVKDLHLENNIHFIGYIPDDELQNYYNRSKVCVFPSFAREGVLTTMLEAASCGRAIITTNCCGMPDFLNSESNGLLVEPENSIDLERAIKRLLDDQPLRDKLGKQARNDILNGWTWDKSIQKIIPIINSLK